MTFYLIGIDHKNAPLMVREETYRQRQDIYDFWQTAAGEAAVLFTCNRVEVYGAARDVSSVKKTINLFRIRFPGLFDRAYVKKGNGEVIHHALRLASGLESLLLGEREIMEQLNSWISQDLFPVPLRKMWMKTLIQAQDIRNKSALDGYVHNIAELVLEDLSLRVGTKEKKKIVIIGTGKIARLFAEKYTPRMDLYFVSRKKHSKARRLAEKAGGTAVLMKDLSGVLSAADTVISATSSPHYVLRKHQLIPIIEKREKDLYIYDLAVPRDIEPDIKNIKGALVRNLDDLVPLFEKNNRNLFRHVQRAEFLIEEAMKILKEEGDIDAHPAWDAAQLAGVNAD
ncbi:hypothetical protein ACFL5Y_00710 [Candidatus Omnitrophota bacterium]